MHDIRCSLSIIYDSYVVGKIGVHDDDKVSGWSLHPVDVGGPQTKLFLSRSQNDFVRAVDFLEALSDLECSSMNVFVLFSLMLIVRYTVKF